MLFRKTESLQNIKLIACAQVFLGRRCFGNCVSKAWFGSVWCLEFGIQGMDFLTAVQDETYVRGFSRVCLQGGHSNKPA